MEEKGRGQWWVRVTLSEVVGGPIVRGGAIEVLGRLSGGRGQ